MKRTLLLNTSFLQITVLGVLYLIVELLYIQHTSLSLDEIWYIDKFNEYIKQLNIFGTTTIPINFLKYSIAFINSLILISIGGWLTQFFNKRAVFFALTLIIFNQLFLIYSVEFGVEIIAFWLCWISIAFVVSKRLALAGTFFLASLVILYLSSNPQKLEWYKEIYYANWQALFTNTLVLFFLLPLAWIKSFVCNKNKKNNLLILISNLMIFSIILISIPFPASMLCTIPAFFIIYADLFSWGFEFFNKSIQIQQNRQLIYMMMIYAITTFSLMLLFQLPLICFLILLIPLSIILDVGNYLKIKFYPKIMSLLILFIGIFYPLQHFLIYSSLQNGEYQKQMILLANELIAKNKIGNQSNSFSFLLNHPTGPTIGGIYNFPPKIFNVLVPSFYNQPYAKNIVNDIKNKPPLLYINNYWIASLPTDIQDFLHSHYQQFLNSIYLYAPVVSTKDKIISIQFSGTYLIEPEKIAEKIPHLIKIDHEIISTNSPVKLFKGKHLSEANINYRLKLLPDNVRLSISAKDKIDYWINTTKYAITNY